LASAAQKTPEQWLTGCRNCIDYRWGQQLMLLLLAGFIDMSRHFKPIKDVEPQLP
jgi:hypothetical protein